jgi:hypothetical protein
MFSHSNLLVSWNNSGDFNQNKSYFFLPDQLGGRMMFAVLCRKPKVGSKLMSFTISTGFAKYRDVLLAAFASNVAARMNENAAVFPGLAASVASLAAAQTAYHDSIAATSEGGKSLTINKKARRAIVVAILRQLATAIGAIPNMTKATAALSGFQFAEHGYHSATTPVEPVILAITNAGRGKLRFKLQGSRTRRGYELQCSINGGPPVGAGFFSSTRDIVVTGLIPGTTYTFQARALGGKHHVSAWSAPVSCMCT